MILNFYMKPHCAFFVLIKTYENVNTIKSDFVGYTNLKSETNTRNN